MEKINIKLIENFIKENHLTKSKFCKMCKIGLSTLNKILANSENFRIVALFKIAKVLNIYIYQLFI
ncbi:MAG: helix-turn-helix domain-containing protein [Christensenellales bacterium]